jgi:hypothetical protein
MKGQVIELRKQYAEARRMAQRGKGPRTVAAVSGVPLSEARSIVKAHRGSERRKTHKEIQEKMLERTLRAATKAQKRYNDVGPGLNAQAAQAIMMLSAEARALMKSIEDQDKPEEMALIMLRTVMQPLLNSVLHDVVVEARKARKRCGLVAMSPEQEVEITSAFKEMIEAVGKVSSQHLGMNTEKMATVMGCKFEDIQRLARERPVVEATTSTSASASAIGGVGKDRDDDE